MPNDLEGQRTFVQLFVEEMTAREIPACTELIGKNDVKGLKKKAHTMKSNVSYFGLDEIADSLKKIEDMDVNASLNGEVKMFILLTLSNLESACKKMESWCLESESI